MRIASTADDGSVTLLCEEPLLPYRRPPLTKELLRGEIDPSEVVIAPPAWFHESAIDALVGQAAVAIDPERGSVTIADGRELPADAIVLATGSEPTRPDFPGASDALAIRRLPDSLRLRNDCAARSAAVVGGGFIASEAAASLALRGVVVTLIDRNALPQAPRIGEEAATRLAGWLDELGVIRLTSATARAITPTQVERDDGRVIDVARTVLATGVEPRSELAAAVGADRQQGRVTVDSAMRVPASDGRLFAVGDVAVAEHGVVGRSIAVEHWGDALVHGACAGGTLAGDDVRWSEVPGFWTTIGSHTMKYAGWGDGFEVVRFVDHGGGAFTAWYLADRVTVGVLTHKRDEDYERGRELIATRARPLA